MGVVVTASGMINAAGIGVEQVAASVGAGLCLYRESHIIDQKGVPFTLALVPEACLPELEVKGKLASPKARYQRMLKLSKAAFGQLQPALKKDRKTALWLALPERAGGRPFPALEPFLKDLYEEVGCFDLAQSKVYPEGRAAGVLALQGAMQWLQENPEGAAIVGGVDSSLDLALLDQWGHEQRLLTPVTKQGFVPGEGACFLMLENSDGTNLPRVAGVGHGQEPGHHYSDEVCLGTGLTEALMGACAALPQPVNTVCCGLNGENVAVKEWGIVATRVAALKNMAELSHPAECFGDLGAATFPSLIAVACQALLKRTMKPPVALWASSDSALRGAVSLLVS